MANIKANIKNIQDIEKQTARNRLVKNSVKKSVRKAKEGIKSNDKKTTELLSVAHKEIQKAASKGVLHKNNAARKQSRLDKLAHKQLQAA